jgi:hypothetical protein
MKLMFILEKVFIENMHLKFTYKTTFAFTNCRGPWLRQVLAWSLLLVVEGTLAKHLPYLLLLEELPQIALRGVLLLWSIGGAITGEDFGSFSEASREPLFTA